MKKIINYLIGEEPELELENAEKPKQEKKVEIQVEEQLNTTNKLPDEKKMVTIPSDVLEGLVAIVAAQKKQKTSSKEEDNGKFEMLVKQLTEAVKDSSDADNRFLGLRAVSIEDVDKDDILEVPEYYFCYSYGYTIWDDQKYGRTIAVPYGRPLKFKMVYRTVDKAIPKQPKYLTVSALTVWSKRIVTFLDTHNSFGIKFFKKKEQALDVNAALAEKLAVAFNIVQRLQEPEVISACGREGIKIDTEDISELRRRLAMKRAKSWMGDEKVRQNNIAKEFEGLISGGFSNIVSQNLPSAEKQKADAGAVSPY